jgi:hypothetical protein
VAKFASDNVVSTSTHPSIPNTTVNVMRSKWPKASQYYLAKFATGDFLRTQSIQRCEIETSKASRESAMSMIRQFALQQLPYQMGGSVDAPLFILTTHDYIEFGTSMPWRMNDARSVRLRQGRYALILQHVIRIGRKKLNTET